MFGFYSPHTDKNRVTIVAQHEEGILKVAACRCSSQDRFEKKVGRKLAEDRLKEGKLIMTAKIGKCSGRTFLSIAKTLAEEVSTNNYFLKELELK